MPVTRSEKARDKALSAREAEVSQTHAENHAVGNRPRSDPSASPAKGKGKASQDDLGALSQDETMESRNFSSTPNEDAEEPHSHVRSDNIASTGSTIPLFDFDVRLELDQPINVDRISAFQPASYAAIKKKLDMWFPAQTMSPQVNAKKVRGIEEPFSKSKQHKRRKAVKASRTQADNGAKAAALRTESAMKIKEETDESSLGKEAQELPQSDEPVHLQVEFVPQQVQFDRGLCTVVSKGVLAYAIVAQAPDSYHGSSVKNKHNSDNDNNDDNDDDDIDPDVQYYLTLGHLVPNALKDAHHPLMRIDPSLVTKEWIQFYGEVTLLRPFLPPKSEVIGPESYHPYGRFDKTAGQDFAVGEGWYERYAKPCTHDEVPTPRLYGILNVQVGLEPTALRYGSLDAAADGFIESECDLRDAQVAGALGLARALKQAIPSIVDWKESFVELDSESNTYWDRNQSYYDLPPKQGTLGSHQRIANAAPIDLPAPLPTTKRRPRPRFRYRAFSRDDDDHWTELAEPQGKSPSKISLTPLPPGKIVAADAFGDAMKETFLPLDTNIASLLEACRPPPDGPTEYPPTDIIPTPLLHYQARCLAWMVRRETQLDEDVDQILPHWVPIRTKTAADVCLARKQLEMQRQAQLDAMAKGQRLMTKKLKSIANTASNLVQQGATTSLEREPFIDPVDVKFYYDQVSGMLSLRRFTCRRAEPGGALCESMGLGKTLESLSLVAARPRPMERELLSYDTSRSAKMISKLHPDTRPFVSRATLVVCPAALVEQWLDEIRKHFRSRQSSSTPISKEERDLEGMTQPGVVRYSHSAFPWNAETPREEVRAMARDRLTQPDIVVATYEELASQLAESSRAQQISSVRTPLLEVLFWRILLDEAQIVAGASTKATQMIHELWRSNCWMVTGTPVTKGIKDIQGIFAFLDHDPFAAPKFFNTVLQEPFVKGEVEGIRRLRSILPRFVWRHTKAHVENEIDLPASESEVLEIELKQLERLFYDREVKRYRETYVMKAIHGAREISQPDFLVNLRQLLSHPQIADQNSIWQSFSRLSFSELFRQFCEKAESELDLKRMQLVYSTLQLVWGHDFYDEETSKTKWTGGRKVLKDRAAIREVLEIALSVTHKALEDKRLREEDSILELSGSQDGEDSVRESDARLGSQVQEQDQDEPMTSAVAETEANPTSSPRRLDGGINVENQDDGLHHDDQAWGGNDAATRVHLTWEEARYWLLLLLHKHRDRRSSKDASSAPAEPIGRWGPERPTRSFFEKAFKSVNDKSVDLEDPRFHLVVQDAGTEDMDEDDLLAQIEAEALMAKDGTRPSRLEISEQPYGSSLESEAGPLDSEVAFESAASGRSRKRHKKDKAIGEGLLKKSRLRGGASQRKVGRVWYYKPKERLETIYHRLTRLMEERKTKEHEAAFLRGKLDEVQAAHTREGSAQAERNGAFECSVCFDIKEQVGVLPCYHTFCIDCIESIGSTGHGKCPTCRNWFSLRRVTRLIQQNRAPSEDESDYVVGDWGGKISGVITDLRARLKVDNTHKAVIFSHWKKMLVFMRDALVQNGIPTVVFSGNEAAQADALRAIRDDSQVKVILVPFRASAGAAGLTLTSCNLAYLMEPALDAALEAQAIGRVHRIGQTKKTKVIRVKMKDTIEDAVMRLADERSRKGVESVSGLGADGTLGPKAGHGVPVGNLTTTGPVASDPAASAVASEASTSTSVLSAIRSVDLEPSLRVRSIASSLGSSVGVARDTDATSLKMEEVAMILGFDIAEEKRKAVEERSRRLVQQMWRFEDGGWLYTPEALLDYNDPAFEDMDLV